MEPRPGCVDFTTNTFEYRALSGFFHPARLRDVQFVTGDDETMLRQDCEQRHGGAFITLQIGGSTAVTQWLEDSPSAKAGAQIRFVKVFLSKLFAKSELSFLVALPHGRRTLSGCIFWRCQVAKELLDVIFRPSKMLEKQESNEAENGKSREARNMKISKKRGKANKQQEFAKSRKW